MERDGGGGGGSSGGGGGEGAGAEREGQRGGGGGGGGSGGGAAARRRECARGCRSCQLSLIFSPCPPASLAAAATSRRCAQPVHQNHADCMQDLQELLSAVCGILLR
eukprot:6053567-Pleurochrysis_carterae.AAC.1